MVVGTEEGCCFCWFRRLFFGKLMLSFGSRGGECVGNRALWGRRVSVIR